MTKETLKPEILQWLYNRWACSGRALGFDLHELEAELGDEGHNIWDAFAELKEDGVAE